MALSQALVCRKRHSPASWWHGRYVMNEALASGVLRMRVTASPCGVCWRERGAKRHGGSAARQRRR